MIEKILKNKTSKEKAKIKSQELAKVKLSKFKKDDLEVEIIGDIKNVNNHIEFYAKAWKGEKQLGFGKKGDVETEHFIIHNPPVLVDDPNGDIIREWTDEKGELKQRKLKYDPAQALKNSLAHTISLVAKDGKDIIKGKVGNTTSTFYPDAGTGNTTVDGYAGSFGQTTWNLAHDNAGGSKDDTAANIDWRIAEIGGGNNYQIMRLAMTYDTSAISDTDIISSSILSLWSTIVTDEDNDGDDFLSIVSSTLANDNAVVNADYTQIGDTIDDPTEMHDVAQRKDLSSWTTGQYTDWTLNSTGIANISKTGISGFGMREGHDILDNAIANSTKNGVQVILADTAGTDKDPKLVVVHSAEAVTFSVIDSFSLSESQKSLRGLKFFVADNFNLSDAISSIKGLFFIVIDSINLTEKISSARSFVFNVADSLSLTDSTKILRKMKFAVVSVISLADKFITTIKKGYIQMRSKKQNYPIEMNDENDIAMKSKQQNYPIGMNDDRTL